MTTRGRDDGLQNIIWNGSLPLKIRLSPSDSRVYDQADPYFVCGATIFFVHVLIQQPSSCRFKDRASRTCQTYFPNFMPSFIAALSRKTRFLSMAGSRLKMYLLNGTTLWAFCTIFLLVEHPITQVESQSSNSLQLMKLRILCPGS